MSKVERVGFAIALDSMESWGGGVAGRVHQVRPEADRGVRMTVVLKHDTPMSFVQRSQRHVWR
jgi:hypothetical protein